MQSVQPLIQVRGLRRALEVEPTSPYMFDVCRTSKTRVRARLEIK